MLEPKDLHAHFDRLAEGLEECRAATDTIAEGDPSAMEALREAVDAMTSEVAALKAATAGAAFG